MQKFFDDNHIYKLFKISIFFQKNNFYKRIYQPIILLIMDFKLLLVNIL